MFVLFLACTTTSYTELRPAELSVSVDAVEFGPAARGGGALRIVTLANTGEVPLGLASIGLSSDEDASYGHRGSFQVSFVDEDAPEDTDATDDTDDADADSDVPDEDGIAIALGPGERLPVEIVFSPAAAGDNFDGLVIATADEADPDPRPELAIHRDADRGRHVVPLHGLGATPDVVVGPRTVDFGFVWEGRESVRYVTLQNRGDAPLAVTDVSFTADCDGGFQIVDAPAEGGSVDGGTTSVVQLRFAPAAAGEARGTLIVDTHDPDSPHHEIRLFANRESDAGNALPIVAIHAPGPGYVHQGWGPIALDVTVADPDQPAPSLTCRVRSAWQRGFDAIVSCTASDAGRFVVDVPVTALDFGPDVLVLQATDGFGATRKASVPVLIDASWSADDEDGDGWPWSGRFGDQDIPPDCDDGDVTTYPFATEHLDAVDNDCDGLTDEETEAGDDDGDGVSERDGDCDDGDPAVYPRAPEIVDSRDQDCDALVDEETDAYDDDQDGFAELDRDCDDHDDTVHPTAVERCDNGVDDDCNGRTDAAEVCASALELPLVVGGLVLDRTAVEVGGTLVASVHPYLPGGGTMRHEWAMEGGTGRFDDAHAARVVWTAPDDLPGGANSARLRLSYLGQDSDGHQLIGFADVDVYATGLLAPPILVAGAAEGGCATVGPGGLVLAGLAAWFTRSRLR
jgi:hypothetical protein